MYVLSLFFGHKNGLFFVESPSIGYISLLTSSDMMTVSYVPDLRNCFRIHYRWGFITLARYPHSCPQSVLRRTTLTLILNSRHIWCAKRKQLSRGARFLQVSLIDQAISSLMWAVGESTDPRYLNRSLTIIVPDPWSCAPETRFSTNLTCDSMTIMVLNFGIPSKLAQVPIVNPIWGILPN